MSVISASRLQTAAMSRVEMDDVLSKSVASVSSAAASATRRPVAAVQPVRRECRTAHMKRAPIKGFRQARHRRGISFHKSSCRGPIRYGSVISARPGLHPCELENIEASLAIGLSAPALGRRRYIAWYRSNGYNHRCATCAIVGPIAQALPMHGEDYAISPCSRMASTTVAINGETIAPGSSLQ